MKSFLFNIITQRKGSAFIRGLVMAAFVSLSLPLYAADISLGMRLGYSPHAGGTMHSGWQADTLGVYDGLNSINRSSDTLAVTTVEVPLGAAGAFEIMFSGDTFYFKTGVWGLYTVAGGSGKTIDPTGTEIVKASYSHWAVDVPVTFGINLFYWGESRIYMGCGAAYAYGLSKMSFSSSSVTYDHSAGFAGYAFPVLAELGCEYMTGERTAVGCGVRYMYGKSEVIENGSDYAVVDFTGYTFTLSASVHFYPGRQ